MTGPKELKFAQSKDVTSYSLSDSWGKKITLWRNTPGRSELIARFPTDAAAQIFAKEFNFPLSDSIEQRFAKLEKAK